MDMAILLGLMVDNTGVVGIRIKCMGMVFILGLTVKVIPDST